MDRSRETGLRLRLRLWLWLWLRLRLRLRLHRGGTRPAASLSATLST